MSTLGIDRSVVVAVAATEHGAFKNEQKTAQNHLAAITAINPNGHESTGETASLLPWPTGDEGTTGLKKRVPTRMESRRYHDLDALRAFAMLLGIVLHGLMSFVELPAILWPAQDFYQHKAYQILLEAIHGFRMPLFFLISGFFTAMMWRKRGLGYLVRHRARRIGLPLILGMVTIIPLVFAVGIGAFVLSLSSTRIFTAAETGDLQFVEKYAQAGANLDKTMLIGARDAPGLAPLHIAVLHGETEVVNLLLRYGGDPDVRQAGPGELAGVRPLHLAAATRNLSLVNVLLAAGANINTRAKSGFTPLDAATRHLDVVFGKALSESITGTVDLPANRQAIVELLASRGAQSGDDLGKIPDYKAKKSDEELLVEAFIGLSDGARIVFALVAFPLFSHLWFLWYLLWLVAAFVVVVKLMHRFGWRLPAWLTGYPSCWLWSLPLTLMPQLVMLQPFGLGPDGVLGIVPWPPLLFYYGIFFGFGAICYGRPAFEQNAGQRWPLLLTLSLAVLIVGHAAFEARAQNFVLWHPVLSLCSVLYVWFMTFGMIGLFRRFLSGENKRIRYLSDSSYWLYIAHLPVVQLLQIWLSDWPLPGPVKLFLICGITIAVLLLTYEYLVRYRWLGTLLNGKRMRPAGSRSG